MKVKSALLLLVGLVLFGYSAAYPFGTLATMGWDRWANEFPGRDWMTWYGGMAVGIYFFVSGLRVWRVKPVAQEA